MSLPANLHILHLTVLNPAVHTRIFYKIARSQQRLGAKVSIAGQSTQSGIWEKEGITIIATKPFGRFAWERMTRQIELFRIAWKARPNILTIHAAELLYILLLYKLLRPRTKLIYDVHENYYYNIRYSHPNPSILHIALGRAVRQVEKWSVRYLDAVCYAEECYENILNVPATKKYFLRNKFTWDAAQEQATLPIPARPYMLYTGTIDINRGIYETLDLWKKINAVKPFLLVIAGHTFAHHLIDEIHDFAEKNGLVSELLIYGGSEYLPYSEVVHFIRHCTFGTGFYNTERKNIAPIIPTKIYEFMAFNKPLIYQKNPHWDRLNERWGIGIAITQETLIEDLLQQIETQKPPPRNPREWSWETEEEDMKRMLDHFYR